MPKYEQYEHYGKMVWVKSELKGKHRNHCLCWDCNLFKPDNRKNNCKIANENYKNCIKFNTVQPVWECPNFEKK